MLWQASEEIPVIHRNTGRVQEKERLSWSYRSRSFHWYIKRQEKLITDKDTATSNPAPKYCLKWSLLFLGGLIYMQ